MNDRDLWHAIYDLYELLLERENREDSYQAYFEAHSVVFRCLGFDANQSYEKRSGNKIPRDQHRGYRPEPDFLCGDHESGRLTVFELKTPFVTPLIVQRRDGARKKLNAQVEEYVSQSTEYAESIREREEARRVVARDLGMEAISHYEIVLVHGLAEDNKPDEVSRLLDTRKIPTEILYYDTLLDRLVGSYQVARRTTEDRAGFCIVCHLVLHPDQLCPRAYVLDHGIVGSNRLSVFIENGNIVFVCIDSRGTEHRLEGTAEFGGHLFLRVEFSNDDDGIYMSLNLNNEERDARIGSVPFRFHPDMYAMYMGADLTGQNCGRFQMTTTYRASRTMRIGDKLGSFHYFKKLTSASPSAMDFDGSQFYVRNSTGDLVQDDIQRAPTFRKQAGY